MVGGIIVETKTMHGYLFSWFFLIIIIIHKVISIVILYVCIHVFLVCDTINSIISFSRIANNKWNDRIDEFYIVYPN